MSRLHLVGVVECHVGKRLSVRIVKEKYTLEEDAKHDTGSRIPATKRIHAEDDREEGMQDGARVLTDEIWAWDQTR